MNAIAYRSNGTMEAYHPGERGLDGAPLSMASRAGKGLACAGFSVLLTWAAIFLQTSPGLTTPADQVIAWVLLAGWLLYWGIGEGMGSAGKQSHPGSHSPAESH